MALLSVSYHVTSTPFSSRPFRQPDLGLTSAPKELAISLPSPKHTLCDQWAEPYVASLACFPTLYQMDQVPMH